MRIIEQSHEILSYDDIGMLETAGRTCYQSQERVGCTTRGVSPDSPETCSWYGENDNCGMVECENHSSHKFVKMLRDRGHHAMIEFGGITVKFITNRGVTHELVRHRMASFAQESTRYVKYDGDEMEFIKPVWMSDDGVLTPAELTWMHSMQQQEYNYGRLIEHGWKAQQAREVLPNSLKTEIVVKANFRQWRHILKLRCAKAAHPQMRALCLPLLAELKEKVPVVFDDLSL